jgi:hypothetical protein
VVKDWLSFLGKKTLQSLNWADKREKGLARSHVERTKNISKLSAKVKRGFTTQNF